MGTHNLSRPLRSDMVVYPGTPPVSIEPAATVTEDGFRTTAIKLDSHTGTHMDAPAHMVDNGRTLDTYPPETFRFEAAIVDCRPLDDREPIARSMLADRAAADNRSNLDMVILRTGWEAYWGDDRYFDHPYLTGDAAAWLAERELHLGVDMLNVDPTPTANAASGEPSKYPAHHGLFAADRLIVENLCGLAGVGDRIDLHAYPLAIEAADGSPVRAVAIDQQ
ncbi:cyclase family protein [Halalkalirubrum salinum]|uniref:cyclase family protein n=1 Tax=Halalkalirubrum salinum TaxID=2563889 RepID=UPI0010FB8AB4|nr:cyclase family protein [Halalkalirubrum salinum]